MLRTYLSIILVCCLSASVLNGCGFQPRGTHNAINQTFSSINLVNGTVDKAFQQALEEALRNSGVELNPASLSKLEILSSTPRKRTASFSSRAKSAEFELLKEVSFRFSYDQTMLIETSQLLARRSYLYRETAAVGKAEEETLLRREMDEDLAQRILLSLQRAVQEKAKQ